jgi:hypothetical protein
MDSYAALSHRPESLTRFGCIASVPMEPPRVRGHSGDVTNTGTLSSNGVVFGTHKHPVQGSTTGEPQ